MFNFGTGFLFGNPIGGNEATNPTPQYFGTVQDIDVEISATIKELRGNLQFPDDTAIADKKLTGKIKWGRIEIPVFNQLYFADTYVAGVTAVQPREAHSVPATPFQVTIAPPSGGVFGIDLGVLDASTGLPFTKVASGPTTGQYTVSGAVYTFAAADTLRNVLISYTYTLAASGNTLTVNNQVQGYGPVFEIWLTEPYQNAGNGLHLYACKASKLGAPRKRDDYVITEFDFEAFANAAGKVFDWFQVSP
jgi:hypothetical protein